MTGQTLDTIRDYDWVIFACAFVACFLLCAAISVVGASATWVWKRAFRKART